MEAEGPSIDAHGAAIEVALSGDFAPRVGPISQVTTSRPSQALLRRVATTIKRAFDIVLATLLLLVLSPLLLLVSGVLWATNRRVLYRQVRLGQDMRPFRLYKFRTMVDGADGKVDEVFHLNHANGPFFKVRNDPRVTPIGRVLRKAFIDELPQLVNVILGDMSLVGPRPCLPSEAQRMGTDLAFRFSVPQGVTGPWQVNGYHVLTFDEQLRVEREYIQSWSLVSDLKILVKTLPLVLRRRGI